ncbi:MULTISPECIES: hypothetical protein [Streptomyces]|uniref:Uncharacterized protein n=1 Tax=Streptomyces achmelvichensis TaxID=3134111 RepID=A0ACC6Q7C8_9ACTN|nr:hypothetical protein OG317_34790 [Streptomyces sp. NBC_01167]
MNEAGLLTPEEIVRIREGIAAAVLGGPDGLTESLEHDPDGYLRLVAAARIGAEETSRLLRESVQGARAAGQSWDTVGNVLGVSRQAAQQRFASKGPGPDVSGTGERRVLTPLTAFNEMQALAEAGGDGWHVVDYGPLFHVVEKSEHPWEHRRVPFAVGARHRRMERDGWTQIGSGSFPWRYYKRPVAEA